MTDNKAPSLFERIGGAETVNALVSAYFRELHTQPRAPTLCGFYSKATDHYQTRMVEYITVDKDKKMTVTFKDGSEIQV